jgi:hypothetical protein
MNIAEPTRAMAFPALLEVRYAAAAPNRREEA